MPEPELWGVRDLVGFFGGRWRLERKIVDAAGVRIGSFSGVAVFSPVEWGLEFREEGLLELGAHRGPAHRCLHYRVSGEGRADVYFDYGTFFHDLDLRTGLWRVGHPCRDDEYRGEFRVWDRDRWRQEWTVVGPAKDHALFTDFVREPGGS
ncbi:hypothetical protein A8924_3986 [Saccharopolyspora erythraea NRRL 2338]|uniref:Uncharacterized protein n=2 Tax=Saccharopolyspora erythraea TaxID=1836 RepID=A4FFP1_SACEN|nr:DUF6314 family protein [Saccharopolyspora erythraea]EQD83146.1 hypothetical protein N599_26805 [Saccharopolyspora erythraea D]PFG96586.1 hypothetical protein A8924_3986 [Saccharopolyspora erythraea NRRL 2338]QRK93065.1 hypothetical protein JQX30_18355 [Saccharopolyspora erythraea]CAM02866.1 hypothetical protein SACE_3592 [Saccharopolyspora erythraea NRRL 2338]